MNMKIKVNRILLTWVWIFATCAQLFYMLYYATGNSILVATMATFSEVLVIVASVVLILLLKSKKRVKFDPFLRIAVIGVGFFPIVSAIYNHQEISISLVLQPTLWVMLFSVFYYATLYYGELPLKKFWVRFSYYAILLFSVPLIFLHLTGKDPVGGIIFRVYGCLTIIPLVLYCTDFRKRYIPILLTLFVTLITLKRAGIVAAVAGLAVFYLTDGRVKASIKSRLMRVAKLALMAIVIGTVAIFALQAIGINVIQRFRELATDGGSGRTFIWATVYNAFTNSTTSQHFLGHGIDAVSRTVTIYVDTSIGAHNDFIEILFDYGYVGILFFFCFWYALGAEWKKQFKQHTETLAIYSYAMIITVMFMMFSYYFIDSSIINFMAIYWGVVFAERKTRNRSVKNELRENSSEV